jgi:hypothetical protein
VRFPDQGRFHPLKYLDGLVRCIRRDGGRLFRDAAVVKVEEASGEVRVTTEAGQVLRAGAAVIATNSPINDHLAIHTKQAPYRTYVIAGRVPRGAVGDALYWDTHDPYHYVRLQEADDGTDWLIVGGEDHKTAHDFDYDERFASLAEWTHRHYPSFGEIEYRWSGQVYEPSDYAAFAGRNPGNENVYVVTGDSGQGMTNGVAASLILRDLVTGTENAWAKAYAPNRRSLENSGRLHFREPLGREQPHRIRQGRGDLIGRRAAARGGGGDAPGGWPSSPPTRMRAGRSTCAPPSAHTPAASSIGTASSDAGTAPAMARSLPRGARSSRARLSSRSPRRNRISRRGSKLPVVKQRRPSARFPACPRR